MGSGFKTFADGDILTGGDVMGYLMRQALITCQSGTRPATPTTGQPIYETDTKLIRVWDGSTWYCPDSPDYTAYTPTFYSNLTSGTTIAGGSISLSYARYQQVNKRVHYYGHATINTTTSNGFGVSLPVNASQRLLSLSSITMHGNSGTYTDVYGDGLVPPISAPYNRFGPVFYNNVQVNVVTSGNTCHWNVTYECG